ncbi:MAG: hypothetical protein ACI85O_003738 [Saprospiraceae bacterium]|jgi:hypothetical protein
MGRNRVVKEEPSTEMHLALFHFEREYQLDELQIFIFS